MSIWNDISLYSFTSMLPVRCLDRSRCSCSTYGARSLVRIRVASKDPSHVYAAWMYIALRVTSNNFEHQIRFSMSLKCGPAIQLPLMSTNDAVITEFPRIPYPAFFPPPLSDWSRPQNPGLSRARLHRAPFWIWTRGFRTPLENTVEQQETVAF